MVFSSLLVFGLSVAQLVLATLPAKLIYEFPPTPPKTLENIAVRPNGQLVLTQTSAAQVYTLDPSASSPSPNLVYTFPNATGTAGITQVSSDVYAVVVGTYSTTTFTGTPGSFSIWRLDLNGATPSAKKVTDVPQGQTLNGATTIPSSSSLVLVADSVAGEVYRVDVNAGTYSVAQSDASMKPTSSGALGINGLHVFASTLYFTNSAEGTVVKVPITTTGAANGAYTVIVHDQTGEIYDDFAIGSEGNLWITDHNNVVDKVTSLGVQTVQVNQTNIDQPTSAAFGTGGNTCTLYVVTAGIGGTDTPAHSGQVFSANTC